MSCNGFINVLNTAVGVRKKESGDLSGISVQRGTQLCRAFPFYFFPASLTWLSPTPGSSVEPLLPHSLGLFPFKLLPSFFSHLPPSLPFSVKVQLSQPYSSSLTFLSPWTSSVAPPFSIYLPVFTPSF